LKIIIGSDHGGLEVKEFLKTKLAEKGHQVTDVGTNGKESVDYPDFAQKVAEGVAFGGFDRGIMIDAIGNASAITANKVPGVRAAVAINEFSVISSREHNNANVLTMGGQLFSPAYYWQLTDIWLNTEYAGGRHQKRLDKIAAVEQKYLGGSQMQVTEELIRTIVLKVLQEIGYISTASDAAFRQDTAQLPSAQVALSEIKTAGMNVAAPMSTKKKVIVESDIIQAVRAGQKKLTVPLTSIITQLALDAAKDAGLVIERR